jgi:hypothetical protein
MGATGPEAKIKKKVKDLLTAHGIWYFMPGNNGFGKSGIPDIIAIIDGRFVGIECKADKTKKPTPLQLKCGDEIMAAGGEWYLVYDDVSIQEMAATEGLVRC